MFIAKPGHVSVMNIHSRHLTLQPTTAGCGDCCDKNACTKQAAPANLKPQHCRLSLTTSQNRHRVTDLDVSTTQDRFSVCFPLSGYHHNNILLEASCLKTGKFPSSARFVSFVFKSSLLTPSARQTSGGHCPELHQSPSLIWSRAKIIAALGDSPPPGAVPALRSEPR